MKIEFEGCEIEALDKNVYSTGLLEGETYIAKRNTGWHLLTCKRVDIENACKCEDCLKEREGNPTIYGAWVYAKEPLAYTYSCTECFKVVSIDGMKV